MANVVRFKKRSVAASLSNYYARIYSKADGRIIYAGNGLSSDAQGNVTVDIGEASMHGQHVNGFAGDVSDFVLALGSAFVSDADYNEGDAPLNKQAANILASSVEEGNAVSARKGFWVSNDEITYTYQWKLNGTDISGATTGSILTDESMIDGTLTCVVTATNKYGSTSSTTNGVSVTGEGGGDSPTPLDYDNVVVVGASIIERSFGQDLQTPNTAATQAFKDAGNNVNVYGFGWSGTTASFIANKLQEAMDLFPTKTLFIVHGGGNDVSSKRPYSGLDAGQVTAVSDDFQSLIDVAAQRPSDCIVCNITFRPYANITSNEIFLDESLGSKPFNDNILLPKVSAAMNDTLNSDGNSFIDLYNWTRNDYKKLLSADGVHLSSFGEVELPKFIAERSAYKINASATPDPIVRRDGVTVAFGNQVLSTTQISSVTETEFNAGLPIELAKDFESTGTVTLNITPSSAGTVNSGGANVGGNIFLGDLNFNDVSKSSIYISSGDTVNFDFSNLEPNSNYECSFIGSRTAADERITRFSSGSIFADVYTSPTPANEAVTVLLTSDSAGSLDIVMSVEQGDFGYIGGMQLSRVS